MSIAEPPQFIVDEFTAVVRVQDQDRERQGGEDMGEGSEHKDLCTAGNCNNLCPSRTAVGDREGVTIISCCLPSIMTHQVYLHLSRSSSRELPGKVIHPRRVLPPRQDRTHASALWATERVW